MFLDKGDFMEKIYKNKPVVDKNGRYSMEQIELDSIKTVITELTEPQLKDLLAIIQFQQRVNKLFFDEEDKFEQYEDESNKAWKEYKKIKEAKEVDLKKCERVVAKALEDYCDVNGKSLILEVARRLCRGSKLRDVVSWTFSINEVYEDNYYEWMY